jgi:hypothetical protein
MSVQQYNRNTKQVSKINTYRLQFQILLQLLRDTIDHAPALPGLQDPSGDLALADRALHRAAAREEVLHRHGCVRLRLVHDRRFLRDLVDWNGRVYDFPLDG